MNADLAYRFSTALEKSGMTRAELAAKAGLAPSEITRFFKPDSNPTLRTVERIADALKLDWAGVILEWNYNDIIAMMEEGQRYIQRIVARYFDLPIGDVEARAIREELLDWAEATPIQLAVKAHGKKNEGRTV